MKYSNNIDSEKTKMLKKYRSNIDSLLLHDAWRNDSMRLLQKQIESDVIASYSNDALHKKLLFYVLYKLTTTESNRKARGSI